MVRHAEARVCVLDKLDYCSSLSSLQSALNSNRFSFIKVTSSPHLISVDVDVVVDVDDDDDVDVDVDVDDVVVIRAT